MTQQRHPDIDVFETSSFASLIQQEELEEVIPLDLHTAALIGDYDLVRGNSAYCLHYIYNCVEKRFFLKVRLYIFK